LKHRQHKVPHAHQLRQMSQFTFPRKGIETFEVLTRDAPNVHARSQFTFPRKGIET
jgi:hypothetical protein